MEWRKRLVEVEGHSSGTSELRQVIRERDELKQAVSSFETELMEIQTEAKALAEDRDNFKLLYEQVHCYTLIHNILLCNSVYIGTSVWYLLHVIAAYNS